MIIKTQVVIPSLVRVKPGAIDRLGLYLKREGHTKAMVVVSQGMIPEYLDRVRRGMGEQGVSCIDWIEIGEASFETATKLFTNVRKETSAMIGLGGGKALDVAKYVAFLGRLPYYAVPTSLSNDGFSSPQSSLTVAGRRKSLAAALPSAVVVDLDVCKDAPRPLWLSGIGDLASKLTAIFDWKLAFHQVGEPVDDFAALLSDATVHQFLARPSFDLEGAQLLASSLMFNGIAMEICGSSRPASGSEHLISHALDATSARPRLHGLQVGVATYLMSLVQENQSERIDGLFNETGFWRQIESDPFSRAEWRSAIEIAPTIKDDFYTILSQDGAQAEAISLLDRDERLKACFGP
ncbi:iron-containing alcohol dehydrogenase family protein [Paludisphaera borealis]|uniref:Glycerol-1-phosphate dehydrogenase [NAD(P)+] n=1 Tax=Paludisphaera borealis TaxID=1387353 RepID=A0A1U7CUR1_9BACT|nr:iron-containing alcohol dehydrogenase family protein [Paludisphaera borealis]APW62690.1 Glycerol-1-phosphate dehydrogenase [NAD(P)+] [Paludisphaera borealis]